MAKNPMQRKAQNSFLLGMLITLLITGIIIALLVVQLTKITNEQKAAQSTLKRVYVLAQDVNSGDEITTDKMVLKEVSSETIPENNVLTPPELEKKLNITDEEVNLIRKVSVVAKIDLKKGTVVTTDMITEQGELTADTRKVEYNMIVLPSQLQTNKYIDVRLSLPSGEDLIVVSHKKIEIPNADGLDSLNTIWMNLREDEILTLNCAIVECYQIPGSKLHITEYIEPGLQTAAQVTYLPGDQVINLIHNDPNCVTEAKNEIIKRNNNAALKSTVRNPVNSGLSNNAEDAADNIIDKREDEIKTTQEQRQLYLESLGG